MLYFITELNVGGAERSLARLLAGLDRTQFNPTVACLYGSKSPVTDDIRALDIPVYDLGMPHKWRLDAFLRLFRLLRKVRPAILHTLLFHANIPGRVIGRLAGVPVIISSERTMGMENRWRYCLNRLTHSLADRVVCVSPQVADFVIGQVGVPQAKVVVIPNGVDPAYLDGVPGRQAARTALGLPADGTLVGTVARLDPVKRLDVLLRALALLQSDASSGEPDASSGEPDASSGEPDASSGEPDASSGEPDASSGDVDALIVGYGPEKGQLEALAGRLGIANRVLLAGLQRDVRPWLAALDVFVLSSDWEGMSNALLEAMAVGLPIVATAVGGTPDVVADGETGFLVPPGNAPALAQAIQSLVINPELRERMGQAGRRRVMEHFSAEQMVERTQALYSSLLVAQAASGCCPTKTWSIRRTGRFIRH